MGADPDGRKPRAARRVVDCASCDEHFAARQQGGCVVGNRLADASGQCPTPAGFIVEFRARQILADTKTADRQDLAIEK